MTRARDLAINLALLGFGLLIGAAAATQSVAAAYHYHQALGRPLFALGTIPVYAPWRYLAWHMGFGARDPHVFAAAQSAGLIAFCVGCSLLVVRLVTVARRRAPSTTHGSARWATTRELQDTGLLSGRGIVLCQTDDARFALVRENGLVKKKVTRLGTLLRDDTTMHTLMCAPTRSGKGVGAICPTLLSWPASVIAWDIKKELWHITSGFRHQFTNCYRFEPAAADSTRYNPLFEIRKGVSEVRDTQAVVEMLIDPDGGKEKDHWALTASSLLVGVILHVLYAEKDKSLAGVAHFLSDPGRTQFDMLELMKTTNHLGDKPHPVVAAAAAECLNKPEEELGSVVSTAVSALGLYRDPLVARAVSASDFRIQDLVNAERPASLYLVVSPADLDRVRPLMRIVINQIGRRLTESNASGGAAANKHRLLLLLDELPSLGKLAWLEGALGYLAGFGIKCFLIAQDLNQLDARYGDKNSIMANCHVRIFYGANDEPTAERISKMTGQATHQSEQVSHSGSRDSLRLNQQSKSNVETARNLLTPDEVLHLDDTDALLFVGSTHPYRAKKVQYYADPKFIERAAFKPPTAAQLDAGRLAPATNDWEPTNPVKRLA